MKVFTVDFFFAANEIFFCLVLLFTLIFMNSLDEKSPTSVGSVKSSEKLDTVKKLWLAFTVYFAIRAVVLFLVMNSLSFEVACDVYARRVYRNYVRSRQAQLRGEEAKPDIVISKPSGFNKFLNLMQVTPGYYADSGDKDNKVAPTNQPQSEDTICTICFSNESNCIIFNCKHSGVCKDCSVDMIKKAPVCPFCRQDIAKICVIKLTEEGKIEVIEEIAKEKKEEKKVPAPAPVPGQVMDL